MFWEAVSWFIELYFFLLAIGWFSWYGKRKDAIGLTCLLVLESILVMDLKILFKQPRPAGATEITYSFPSGHTSKAGALAGFVLDKKNFPILLLPVLVGASRLFLGEHTLIDIIAGGSLGLLVGFIFRKMWNRLPVISFGKHHRFGFGILSAIFFVGALYYQPAYLNYIGAITGLIIGFLIGGERQTGKKVFMSGLVGFVLFLMLIYFSRGYVNFFLNFGLGLWISILNSALWEKLNSLKS